MRTHVSQLFRGAAATPQHSFVGYEASLCVARRVTGVVSPWLRQCYTCRHHGSVDGQTDSPCSTRLRGWSTLPVEPSTWHRSSVICTGFDISSGSTTNWRCWSIDASLVWRRTTSPTNSCVCRRLSRDGIFGRLRRPISSCLLFSGILLAVVHSLWQRLKHGTAYRHMSHHLHRWRHSNAISRLSCSWGRTFKPDIG